MPQLSLLLQHTAGNEHKGEGQEQREGSYSRKVIYLHKSPFPSCAVTFESWFQRSLHTVILFYQRESSTVTLFAVIFPTENYGDLRKTPLYFAISNGDITCAEVLLAAGARADLDPLRCVLVAVRAERCASEASALRRGARSGALCDAFFRLQARSCAAAAVLRRRRELLLQSDQQHAVPHSAAVLPERPHHDETAAQWWIPSLQVRLRLHLARLANCAVVFLKRMSNFTS